VGAEAGVGMFAGVTLNTLYKFSPNSATFKPTRITVPTIPISFTDF